MILSNYHPISKLSIISKLFEAIISKNLSSLLINYTSSGQHSFLSKYSIFTNISVYQNFSFNALD